MSKLHPVSKLLRSFFIGSSLLIPYVNAGPNAFTSTPSELVECAGKVEISQENSNLWRPAKPKDFLRVGDQLRTSKNSRATVRLSDKSIIRVDQNSVLEITAPVQPPARNRFRLRWGALFFLNRENPANIEFETPLATGAIRGTEFYLTAAETSTDTTLALFEGEVSLKYPFEILSLRSGQQAALRPGQRAVVTAALPVQRLIQWTFYYSAVLNPADLVLADNEHNLLADALNAYRQGDLLRALLALPEDSQTGSDAARIFRAALMLAVGRVDTAESLLRQVPAGSASARALRESIRAASLGGETNLADWAAKPMSSSECLARSYSLQLQSRLPEALAAAKKAAEIAPDFGFAWARVAELEFSFAHRNAARKALAQARLLSPRHAQAVALEGFIALDENKPRIALGWFEQAIDLDAALGSAWLGCGLAHEQLGDFEHGRRALLTAAALEPTSSLLRSYLGKAFSQTHEDALASRDFAMAKSLDPGDPTPWLYSALHNQQMNRVNDAVRDLEHSLELNDNRSVFRSRLLLDRDRAIRSADLAAIYHDAGLSEVSRLEASRAVSADYANFSGHLFLANSLQQQEDLSRYDLRYETPRQSELLLANLLAPTGGGNLSQLLTQQEHLRYFDARPLGVSSLTQYGSQGDWEQSAAVFGTLDGLSYALDSQYLSLNGQQPNGSLEQTRVILSLRQQLTPSDSVYAQVGFLDRTSGDVAQHYNPAAADRSLQVDEHQEPAAYAGYMHEWSPGNHTLLLVGHLRDQLTLQNRDPSVLFLRERRGAVIDVGLYPFSNLSFESDFYLTSVELQHIWETDRQTLVFGGRYQNGEVDNRSILAPLLGRSRLTQSLNADLERVNGYAYYQIRPFSILRATAGFSYDDLTFPQNADLPPISGGEEHRSLLAPKAALELDPWKGGHARAVYTRSLGGLYFDSSVRLEPAQLAGFTTAVRSLVPESVAGLVPGTEFETWGVGFDQSFPKGTYFGIEGEILKSDGERSFGAVANSGFIPVPDSAVATLQSLEFREQTLRCHVNQLLGRQWALGASYSLSEAEFKGSFPDLPTAAPGLFRFTQNQHAILGQLQLSATFNHESGFFTQWESDFYHQDNSGYSPALPGDCFWQHQVHVGYRLPRRQAEIRLGILNLTDNDYRLNPLNLHRELPRGRMFVASLKLNF